MTLIKQLKELAIQFEDYAPVWRQWKTTHYHSLSPLEITTIELHKAYDFELKDISGMMACVLDEKNIKSISKKLSKDKDEFKDWVIREFQFGLIKLDKRGDLDTFYKMAFNKMDIAKELKRNLLAFGYDSLDSLFKKYSEEDLKKDLQFKLARKVLEEIYQLPKAKSTILIEGNK